MVGAVANDKYGIVYADMGSMMKGVKRLPIARDDHQPMVEMSLDSLHDRSYPLCSWRSTCMYCRRKVSR